MADQDYNPFSSEFDERYNPYQDERADPGTIYPTRVAAADVLNHAFAQFGRHWGPLLGAVLVMIGIEYGLRFAQGILVGAILQVPQQVPVPWQVGVVSFSPLQIGLMLMNTCVSVFLQIGMSRMMLSAARDQSPRIEQLFSGGPWFLPVLGAGILFFLAISAGTLLLILPGILIAMAFWPYRLLIVDNRTGALDAFGVAREITAGNWGTTILLFLVTVGVGILGLLACLIGLFVALPLISLIWTTAYLMMAGLVGYRVPGQPESASDYGYSDYGYSDQPGHSGYEH